MTEHSFDPAQRMTPEPPFVEIPHQHAVPAHPFQQTLNLNTAFPRPQAEMRRNHLYRHSVAHQIEIDGSARLVPGETEIEQSNLAPTAPGEHRVAVMAFALEQSGAGNHL